MASTPASAELVQLLREQQALLTDYLKKTAEARFHEGKRCSFRLRRPGDVPEKWEPVFRKGHAQTEESGAEHRERERLGALIYVKAHDIAGGKDAATPGWRMP